MLEENFIFQLSGSKRVTVFPPPAAESGRFFEKAELELFSMSPGALAPRAFLVDPLAADFSAWPGAVGTVHAGEVLYHPSNTLHLVENIGESASLVYNVDVELATFGGLDWRDRIEERGPTKSEWRAGYRAFGDS